MAIGPEAAPPARSGIPSARCGRRRPREPLRTGSLRSAGGATKWVREVVSSVWLLPLDERLGMAVQVVGQRADRSRRLRHLWDGVGQGGVLRGAGAAERAVGRPGQGLQLIRRGRELVRQGADL